MEQSKRNTNRTQDRNAETFDNFAESLEGLGKTGFFYQYCNSKSCREFELLIFSQPHEADEIEKQVFDGIVDRSGVPAMTVTYPEMTTGDVELKYGKNNKVLNGEPWDNIVQLMWSQHLNHEKDNDKCAQYKHELLNKGTWENSDQDTEFSNQARRVPGVRHIDTDGILYCEECLLPLFVIEATSDGCPGTNLAHKRKATSMTRRIAQQIDATPALIQHHYQDIELVNPAFLTTWKHRNERRFERSWSTLKEDFYRVLMKHQGDGSCRPM